MIEIKIRVTSLAIRCCFEFELLMLFCFLHCHVLDVEIPSSPEEVLDMEEEHVRPADAMQHEVLSEVPGVVAEGVLDVVDDHVHVQDLGAKQLLFDSEILLCNMHLLSYISYYSLSNVSCFHQHLSNID